MAADQEVRRDMLAGSQLAVALGAVRRLVRATLGALGGVRPSIGIRIERLAIAEQRLEKRVVPCERVIERFSWSSTDMEAIAPRVPKLSLQHLVCSETN